MIKVVEWYSFRFREASEVSGFRLEWNLLIRAMRKTNHTHAKHNCENLRRIDEKKIDENIYLLRIHKVLLVNVLNSIIL